MIRGINPKLGWVVSVVSNRRYRPIADIVFNISATILCPLLGLYTFSRGQVGYLVLTIVLVIHFLISYCACRFFSRGYDSNVPNISTILITLLSGPITLALTLVVILVTPLKHTDAGLMDGGGTLLVVLSLLIFPFVSMLLVRLAFKINSKRWVKNV